MRTGRVCLIAACALCAALMAAPADKDVSGLQARVVPEWVRDGVVYEINTRTFSKAGNFAGITAKLDDLHKLGVTILWLMPVHPSGTVKRKGTYGSPYSVRDYYAVDPAFGTLDDLKTLIRAAHARGMRVIIDIVPNHTAWDSVMMAHPDFYKKDKQGHIIPPIPDWDDVAALNYANPALREYMTTMMEYWLKDYDLDGFRCDAAGMVPTDYWEQMRPRMDAAKKDVLMLDEWSSPELLVKAFDLDYAWPFHNALTEVLQTGKPASAIRQVWEEQRAKFPRGALHMIFSDNHDEKRAIARFGEKGALAASALVFALQGVPMLYNGMEVGDTTESGGPALFENLRVFWPIVERRPEFPRTYESLTRLRRQHPALRRGDLTWLGNSDESRIVTFARMGAGEEIVFAVNLSNRPFEGSVRLAAPEGFVELEKGAAAGLPKIQLGAWGWRYYHRAAK
ncbi:MAG: alpha-amylase family glycosyl hydrolase [Bryobacteraceae bacterium]